MLTPQFKLDVHHELVIDLFAGGDGRPLTKTAQVRMCGNSVCPPMAKAYVEANYRDVQLGPLASVKKPQARPVKTARVATKSIAEAVAA